jgi:hypothetical protein
MAHKPGKVARWDEKFLPYWDNFGKVKHFNLSFFVIGCHVCQKQNRNRQSGSWNRQIAGIAT